MNAHISDGIMKAIDMHHCFRMAAIHVVRALDWRLRTVKPTPSEQQMLSAERLDHDVMKKFHTWRFSCLLLAVVFVWLDAGFAIVGLVQFIENAHYLNTLGICVFALEYAAELVLAISVMASLHFCIHNPDASVSSVGYGWLLSTVIAIVPLFLPLESLLAPEARDEFHTSIGGKSFPSNIAILYGTYLVPVLLTIPSGLYRGAMRVRGLLRQGSLAGWLALASSFLNPLAALGPLALLSRAPTDFLLSAGILLFILAPVGLVPLQRAVTKPCLFDCDTKGLSAAMNVIGSIQFVGMVLVSVWTIRSAGLGAFDLAQFGCAFFGRLLVTTLVFTGVVFDLVVSNAKDMKDALCSSVMQDRLDMIDSFEDFSLSTRDSNTAALPNSIVVKDVATPHLTETKRVDRSGKLQCYGDSFRNTYSFQASKIVLHEELESVASSSICSHWSNTMDDRLALQTGRMLSKDTAAEYSKFAAMYLMSGASRDGRTEPRPEMVIHKSLSFATTGPEVCDSDGTLAGYEAEMSQSTASSSKMLLCNEIEQLDQQRQDESALSKAVQETARALPPFEMDDDSCFELPARYRTPDLSGAEPKAKRHPEKDRQRSRSKTNGGTSLAERHLGARRSLLLEESQKEKLLGSSSEDDSSAGVLSFGKVTSTGGITIKRPSDIELGNGTDAPAFSCAQAACDPRTDRGIDP